MDDSITTASTAAVTPDRDERIIRAAAHAALAVDGVHHLGTPANRLIAGVRAAATNQDVVAGVRVADRLDGREVLVSVVADYPVNVTVVAGRVRDAVVAALTAIGAGDVIVAVLITDVHGPYDAEETAADEPLAGGTDADGTDTDVPVAAPVDTVPVDTDVPVGVPVDAAGTEPAVLVPDAMLRTEPDVRP